MNEQRIFISHSNKDKDMAIRVCQLLENAGHPCWMAPRDIAPGADWAESIVDAIDHARGMFLLFTEDSNNSVQVKREVERAVSKNIPLMPVVVGKFEPSKSMQYFLSSHQWVISQPDRIDEAVNNLIKQLNGIKEHPKTPAKPIVENKKTQDTPKPPTKQPEADSGNKKGKGVLIGVILALVVAGGLTMYFINSSKSDKSLTFKNPVADTTAIQKEDIPVQTALNETEANVVNSTAKITESTSDTKTSDAKKPALVIPDEFDKKLSLLSKSGLSFDQRNKVMQSLLTDFSGENTMINLMTDGMLDESMSAKKFLQQIITLNDVEIKIIDKKEDGNGKITSLSVETDI